MTPKLISYQVTPVPASPPTRTPSLKTYTDPLHINSTPCLTWPHSLQGARRGGKGAYHSLPVSSTRLLNNDFQSSQSGHSLEPQSYRNRACMHACTEHILFPVYKSTTSSETTTIFYPHCRSASHTSPGQSTYMSSEGRCLTREALPATP